MTGVSEVSPTISVIIAAHNAEFLLKRCIDSILPQLRFGDEVIVVDDGSTDSTSEQARALGTVVRRFETSQGPYAARNHGAKIASCDALVFFDTRCRAEPGWLDSHRHLLLLEQTCLSFGGIEVEESEGLAERAAFHLKPFTIENYLGHQRPYFPAGNLGVLLSDFDKVGGFSQIRSGGDADFCWRVQEEKNGKIVGLEERILVRWQARESIRGLGNQYEKYGRGTFAVSTRDYSRRSTIAMRLLLSPLRITRQFLKGSLKGTGLRVAVVMAYAKYRYEVGLVSAAITTLMENRRETAEQGRV